MPRTGSYYLARIIKTNINQNDILNAIREPEIIERGDYCWTISDYNQFNGPGGENIHFGKLTKFIKEGPVPSLDSETLKTINQITSDMIIASSPFIYIPEYAAIGYLHIWNKIHADTFRNKFADLILTKLQHFFVECKLEAIVDLNTFITKLSQLDYISRIYAKVKPPNPSFGWLWKDLNKYLERRKTEELVIEEKSNSDIVSRLKKYIELIIQQLNLEKEQMESVDIGDAAILMSADGYGLGKVHGKSNGTSITISTRENAIVLRFPVDPDPVELYLQVLEKLKQISNDRYMGH